MLNLLRYEILSRRTSVLGWGIGLGLLSSMYIVVYPQFIDVMSSIGNIGIYRLLGVDLASFAGYIASVVFQFFPIILGVYMIMAGTGTIAGEDDNGTLELVVAMPLPRWQIVTMKALALALISLIALIIIGAINALSLGLVLQTVEADVTPAQLFVAYLSAWPLMLAVMAMSLFLGAFLPNRKIALAVMVGFYLISYLLQSLSALIPDLEGLKTLSIFSYVNTSATIFTEGPQITDIAVLLVLALIFFLLAVWTFQSRNVTVGQWPWRRAAANVITK
jgi:ABC-2 type transport system permease protein